MATRVPVVCGCFHAAMQSGALATETVWSAKPEIMAVSQRKSLLVLDVEEESAGSRVPRARGAEGESSEHGVRSRPSSRPGSLGAAGAGPGSCLTISLLSRSCLSWI